MQRVMVRLIPNGRLLVLRRAEINIYEIPPFATVPVSDQYQGSQVAPFMSVLLPGNRLLEGGVSSILMQPSDTYSLIACTNTGIYLATLSATTSHVRLLHAITDEHRDASFSRLDTTHLGWRRAYLIYYDYALAVSYDTEERDRADVSESCAFRRVTTPDVRVHLSSMMDESSGRIVMAGSKSSLTVFYYSLHDVT